MSWGHGYGYREYIPVAQRKAQARKFAEKQAKKSGRKPEAVSIRGNKIAKTFWGEAWCDHMESFSDYGNRLPRGRTYARNGSVVDLHISTGHIQAIVGGSDVYKINIYITQLKSAAWTKIRKDCSSSIDSLLDLLAGRFSDGVMERLTDRKHGLFPTPQQIDLNCNCPDGAGLCKHLAAVLYGVGARLDDSPDLLFLMRGVDHQELVSEAVSADNLSSAFGKPSTDLAGENLETMFGIELDTVSPLASDVERKKKRSTKTGKTKKKASRKKSVKKKASTTPAKKKAVAKKKTAKSKAKPKAPKQAVRKKESAKKKATTTPAKKNAVAKKKVVKSKARPKVSKKKSSAKKKK